MENKQVNFIPLHFVSEYSLLQSMITMDSLVSYLLENHISSCALVDTNLFGVMHFYNKMVANHLNPIIGLEIDIQGFILHLYAKNNQGYHQLLKIHTLKEKKELHIENLKPLLSDIKIILPYESYSLLEHFEKAYLGYQNEKEKVEALLKTKNIVYSKKIRCLKKEDCVYLDYLEAILKGVSIKEIVSNNLDCYFPHDLCEEDILSTYEFAKDIHICMDTKKNYIPKYRSLENSESFLMELANKGLFKRLKGKVSKNYQDRLNYELSVIQKMGFVDYFLIVYDYVLYAKKHDILVGPGRGSAAGSLVSYCLGITDIDPIKYHLLFERFLNPQRVSMPDIDIDFEYNKRSQVIDYVKEEYGVMHVAPIMTFGTLGAKQVIRDVGRCLDMKIESIDHLAHFMDAKLSLKENLKIPKVAEILKSEKDLQKLYKVSMHLEGLKRHISTHAAGVVISSVELDEVIPIMKSSDGIMTGLTMEYLEDLGLLKMDFLALRNLTIISNVLALIKESTGKIIDLSKIELEDKEIYELFSRADTEGVFQYESSGMKNLMLKMKPTCFSDLIAAVALFRPGPMNHIDSFIARKDGKEKINYLHPDLEPILKETYGIIVYQEQVMQILVKIGGYTYAEADNIRRAMSKKKESVMLSERTNFIKRAKENGYLESLASSIYDLILKFANYGFNKAHSVAYALIGYQMAYLKAKAPMYFIANLLNMSVGSEEKTKEYIDEARAKNISILKPDINESEEEYKILNQALLLPFSSIKNLGSSASHAILEERTKGDFQNYLDFVVRMYGKSVNKKTIISLIDAGALDTFSLTKKTMIENLDVAINYATLVSEIDSTFVMAPELEETDEYDEDVLREKELVSYGFYIRSHPVNKYQEQNIVKIKDVANYYDRHIKCVFLIEKIKSIQTKKGDNMAFLSVSDETGKIDLTVFSSAYSMLKEVKKGDIIRIQGKVTKRFDKYQINLDFLNKI